MLSLLFENFKEDLQTFENLSFFVNCNSRKWKILTQGGKSPTIKPKLEMGLKKTYLQITYNKYFKMQIHVVIRSSAC